MTTKKAPSLFKRGTSVQRRSHYDMNSVSERVYFSRGNAKNANFLTGLKSRVISEVM